MQQQKVILYVFFGMLLYCMNIACSERSFLILVNKKQKIVNKDTNVPLQELLLQVDTLYDNTKQYIDTECSNRDVSQLLQRDVDTDYSFLRKEFESILLIFFVKHFYIPASQYRNIKDFNKKLSDSYKQYANFIDKLYRDEKYYTQSTEDVDDALNQCIPDQALNNLKEQLKYAILQRIFS